MTSFNIRPATIDDAKLIVEIVNESYYAEECELLTGTRTHYDALIADMNTDGNFVFVLEEEGQVIGSILLQVDPKEGKSHFGMLAIKLTHQKRGLARLLVERVEKESIEKGIKEMEISVIHLRPRLTTFYGHLGYKQTATVPFPKQIEDTGYTPKKEFYMIVLKKDL